MRYRRANTTGGTYFFTVNLAERHADFLVRHIEDMRTVMQRVKVAHPFVTLAMVVLPEHLHTIWRLPQGDADYPLRWSQIKTGFSRRLPKDERIRASRKAKRDAVSGNDAIGNTKSGMRPIWRGMWITFTTTPSNTVGSAAQWIGRIQLCTATLNGEY
jgi:REP element-mobilizing transposase RayT